MPDQPAAHDLDKIVNQRVEQRLAADALGRAVGKVVEAGEKQFGGGPRGAFTDACNNLAALGANEKPDFLGTVSELENGHAVLHRLGNDPDEAERILALTPQRRTIELARLSHRLEASASKDGGDAGTDGKADAKPRRAAPAAKPAARSADPDSAPIGDWMSAREKQVAARRRG